jgi:hypothetical protein
MPKVLGVSVPAIKAKRYSNPLRIALLVILLWPVLFYVLMHLIPVLGMLWLLLYQIYYLPLGAWMRQPFFVSDSDISFQVRLPGVILTAIVYTLVYIGAIELWRTSRHRD